MRKLIFWFVLICAAAASLPTGAVTTVQGYVLDPNWYAPHPKVPGVYGTGLYEYGVSGAITGSSVLGLVTNTENYGDNYNFGVFGFFRKPGCPDGIDNIMSWDNWWRSAYLFNQNISGSNPAPAILRLHATMWSYGPTWESNYNEFGQTFAATGSSVVMVSLRSAVRDVPATVSIHQGGPTGPQVGPSRSATLGSGPSDTRFIWNGGEVPTVPGQIYYVKIKGNAGDYRMVLCNNEPIPDFSDAMPDGYAFHNAVPWYETSSPEDQGYNMDLGLTICSDDDGILTNMFIRPGGTYMVGTDQLNLGQTFTARGTSLLSFTAWIPDGAGTYVATVYSGVGGSQIGTAKRSRVNRSADPEIMWVWAPQECPITPGQNYYIEITKDGGGSVTAIYTNNFSMYSGGRAYKNRVAQAASLDLAGTTMEEESAGSATQPTVGFATFPAVALADRGSNSLTLRWTTDVAAATVVQYAPWHAPYTGSAMDSASTTSHVMTLTGLVPNTMYHLRVKCSAPGYRTGVTRDFVVCTSGGARPNLLVNPDFEEGSGASPRKPVAGWTTSGGLDYGTSNGNWFYEVQPYSGQWLLQGSTNGSSVDSLVYQTVHGVTVGKQYNFTCAVSSWMQENGTGKYDVWHQEGRLDYIKIGIDPYGDNNPASTNIKWTPTMYSHLHYTNIGCRVTAMSSKLTVFVSLKGKGGQWHIYGIDNCRLSENEPPDVTAPSTPVVADQGMYTTSVNSLLATWSSMDAESGIQEYQYAIGTQPGQTDVSGWTSTGSAGGVSATGLALAYDQTYYLSVRARNYAGLWSDTGYSDGISVARTIGRIADAKALPDGAVVSLADKLVSAVKDNVSWIEEDDRSCGIKVGSAGAAASQRLASVTGRLATIDGDRMLAQPVLGTASAGMGVEPIFMPNLSLGGSALNIFTPGAEPAAGPNNAGLLVTVYGRVTAVASGYFYIDDGAGLMDGTDTSGAGNVGVRVVGGLGEAAVGDYVAVTGASSLFVASGPPLRQVVAVSDPVKLN